MEIIKEYVVYSTNKIMGNENHLSLEKIVFSGIISNSFPSEDDARNALLEDKKTYEDYVILKQVYIRNSF